MGRMHSARPQSQDLLWIQSITHCGFRGQTYCGFRRGLTMDSDVD